MEAALSSHYAKSQSSRPQAAGAWRPVEIIILAVAVISIASIFTAAVVTNPSSLLDAVAQASLTF